MWQRVLWIGFAGALGTLARYGLSNFVQSVTGGHLPWGTMFVNVVGCFLFGLVFTLADERAMLSDDTRLIILGGFMGAFTTFSTFSLETLNLLNAGEMHKALLNIFLSVTLCLIATWIGMAAARQI